jgi:hypothetical protein
MAGFLFKARSPSILAVPLSPTSQLGELLAAIEDRAYINEQLEPRGAHAGGLNKLQSPSHPSLPPFLPHSHTHTELQGSSGSVHGGGDAAGGRRRRRRVHAERHHGPPRQPHPPLQARRLESMLLCRRYVCTNSSISLVLTRCI